MSVLLLLLSTAGAYLLGSVPFGPVFAKTFCGLDLRTAGSGNVGATNVARLCGKGWGALTLLCDVLKGFLPVFFVARVLPGLLFATPAAVIDSNGAAVAYAATTLQAAVVCTGFAAVAGHMFSLFLRFKGGKGVATGVGVFLASAPVNLIIAGILCLLVIRRSGYVSAGSLTLISALPLLFLVEMLLQITTPGAAASNSLLFILSLVIGGLVAYAHRENIDRLRKGEEKSWITSKADPGKQQAGKRRGAR